VANSLLPPEIWADELTKRAAYGGRDLLTSNVTLAQIVSDSVGYLAPVSYSDYATVAEIKNLPDGQTWGSQKIEIDL
jgi:hypothetical protein